MPEVESVHPAPGANNKTGRQRSFRHPSIAVLVPRAPVTAAPSIEVIRPATASDSNSMPQLFYATQEIDTHFLKGPEPTTNPKPTVYNAPAQLKRCAVESRRWLNWMGSPTTVDLEPPSRSSSHNCTLIQHSQRWDSNAPQASRLSRWKSRLILEQPVRLGLPR